MASTWRPAVEMLRRPALPAAMLVLLLAAGCAFVARPPPPDQAPAQAAAVAECRDWYRRLDEATDSAGVRDAGAVRLATYPYLRVDRFTASLRDLLPADRADARFANVRDALLRRMLELDQQARALELANLPSSRLPAASGGGRDAALQRTETCGRQLLAADLRRPAPLDTLVAELDVPDNYLAALRVFGVYPASRIPFLAGVRAFEAERAAVFAAGPREHTGRQRLHLSPPWRPAPGQVTAARLRQMLQPRADDPLRIPAPSPDEQEWLFARFAPGFDIAVESDADLPGALAWPPAALDTQVNPSPRVASDFPRVYRHLAYTRHGRDSLLQLVYHLWFPARPPAGRFDLLAGHLDALVWRVTLSPDGEPLVYDSIHGCGCYHWFFPGPRAVARPSPEPDIEWMFSPQAVAATGPSEHLVLRVAAGSHYLEGVQQVRSDGELRYDWQPYDQLRSLPDASGQRRSVFGPDGFIPGTDRAEAWFFWPMGIVRAGAMRQWGHHATAFVGRRHFDDARLIEQRFRLDLR